MDRANSNRGHLRLLDLTDVQPDQGVVRLIDYAVRLGASDIFLITNDQNVSVQARYLGFVEPLGVLTLEQGRRYMGHIRAESGMGMTDHRRPQDGRWLFRSGDEDHIDLRLSVIPTIHGEEMGIRILARNTQILTLEGLGLTRAQLDTYRAMLDEAGGMILLTGPTGSGKTVSLYASLEHLNDGHRKLHTIEDPIEYIIDGLHQSQVNTAIELGAAELLRGVLRQAPDAIMVGEVRDAETAETAVAAANSGILVLATIHASTGAGAIQSLRAFGIHPAFVAASLRGTVSQRLLRTLCMCRDPGESPDSDSVRDAFKEVEPYMSPGQTPTLFVPRECERCHHTGFVGRTGAFEIMPMSDSMRDMIIKGRSARQIRARAIDEGVMTLRQAALLKAADGITSLDEVYRCVPRTPEPLPRKKHRNIETKREKRRDGMGSATASVGSA